MPLRIRGVAVSGASTAIPEHCQRVLGVVWPGFPVARPRLRLPRRLAISFYWESADARLAATAVLEADTGRVRVRHAWHRSPCVNKIL